jgi:hypothetical protein
MTDFTYIKIELHESDPRGSSITVCCEGPLISINGEFKVCFKSFLILVKDDVIVSDILYILSSTCNGKIITKVEVQHSVKSKYN